MIPLVKRLEPLDGLRGLAVLLVLASHASVAGLDLLPGLKAEGLGRPGVFLFFVLSSFLLTRQLLERVDSGRVDSGEAIRWPRFAGRRLLRILPAYMLALGIHVIAGVLEPVPALEHLAMVRSEHHFWTIPVEVLFYLTLPLMVFCLGPLKGAPSRIVVLLVAGIAIRWAFPPDFTSSPPHHRPNVAPFLPIFLVGAAMAVLAPTYLPAVTPDPEADSEALQSAARRARLSKALGCAAACVIVLLSRPVWSAVTGQDVAHTRFHLWFDQYALLWAFVLAAALQNGGILRAVACWPPLRWLGQISYSVYLFHALVLGYFVDRGAAIGLAPALLGPGFLVASCLVGALSYGLIERPFLRGSTRQNS